MADTTSPNQSDALNSFSIDSIINTVWDGTRNLFNSGVSSLEHYWSAVSTGSVAAATAAADATRQAALNPPAATSSPISTNTLIMLGLGAAALFIVARK